MMRNSNFELLRLVSMVFIVLYHILLYIITEIDNAILYKAIWIPLHVGVICFVLISGYFHIKPSLRGIVKLLAPLLVFYLPLTVWEYTQGFGSPKQFLFLSKSPYWFIRTYLFLFLVSPVLNEFLKSDKRRLYLLVVLGFIAVYFGMAHEPSLDRGKNMALFMFLYVLGDCLHAFERFYKNWKCRWVLLGYLMFNLILMAGYIIGRNTPVSGIIWSLSYPYCSPLLIINAVLLFIVFSKIKVQSKAINWLGASVFAVYIIHHQHFILYSIIRPAAMWIYGLSEAPVAVILCLAVLTVLILLICILIDKVFTPLWKYLILLANRVEAKWMKTI